METEKNESHDTTQEDNSPGTGSLHSAAQATADHALTAGTIANGGEPIRLTDINMHGISASAGLPGSEIKIWTRLAMTSDDPKFYRIVPNLASYITALARNAGANVNLDRADTVLLVIGPDNTGKLWVDTVATTLKAMPKRPMIVGAPIFESDIADVTAMEFPCVTIGRQDRIVFLFRQDWRFALFFDFNRDGNLDLPRASRDLAKLYRSLKYRHLYDTLADQAVFGRLRSAGWFPFVEIVGHEFTELANHCEAGFDLADQEFKLVASFDRARLDSMVDRWLTKPHFASKEPFLRVAVDAFEQNNPISCIKTVLTEIEGVLQAAYKAATGQGTRQTGKLLEFAKLSAEEKAGGSDSLLFPSDFAKYLEDYTYANFDPSGPSGSASSRHAVGHGAADATTYTQVRALQALLTLDQIAFYT
ncbi:hypothetical protein [Solirhodobacter olei]|uniref:hypothetical protein n=1 Tax=Solirhodobacter olei TaxID=2493082 RepID=UPI0019D43702|nr:hypothetical protein [Solirhodobacter olei]